MDKRLSYLVEWDMFEGFRHERRRVPLEEIRLCIFKKNKFI